MKKKSLLDYKNYFFIGVAGSGMSAIAQYLANYGKNVSGSDRVFESIENEYIKQKLEAEGIKCFKQDGSGLDSKTEVVIVSSAIEDKVPEFRKAKDLGAIIAHRAKMLQAITESKKTIAVAGTSGKSTTVAMIFDVLQKTGFSPSLITGAGLVELQKKGKIGNAFAGKGDWLVIEADESDGSLVNYKPEIGLILNIDKDHKELSELFEIFEIFSQNTKNQLIVNTKQEHTLKYNPEGEFNFGTNLKAKFEGKNFEQKGFKISFDVENVKFEIPTIGQHNMENALATIAVARFLNIDLQDISNALKNYQGIDRRMQKVKKTETLIIIDDYAHNPAKISAAIQACQNVGKRVLAWFQPHGFAPTKFLKNEFITEISNTLRNEDKIYLSEIYYAGGTVKKDISANDIVEGILDRNKNAVFVADRNIFAKTVKSELQEFDVLLLMGARDPSLSNFAKELAQNL